MLEQFQSFHDSSFEIPGNYMPPTFYANGSTMFAFTVACQVIKKTDVDNGEINTDSIRTEEMNSGVPHLFHLLLSSYVVRLSVFVCFVFRVCRFIFYVDYTLITHYHHPIRSEFSSWWEVRSSQTGMVMWSITRKPDCTQFVTQNARACAPLLRE